MLIFVPIQTHLHTTMCESRIDEIDMVVQSLAIEVRSALEEGRTYQNKKQWYSAIFDFTGDVKFIDMVEKQAEMYDEAFSLEVEGCFWVDAIQHYGGLNKAMELVIHVYDGAEYFAKHTKIKNFKGLIVNHIMMDLVHHSSELNYTNN